MLVLINGAPGSGKTTLARRHADAHPMTLSLDVDTVRSLVGGWREQAGPAGLLARLALGMAELALGEGDDVIVPQFLGRPAFIRALADLAGRAAVPFLEVQLGLPAAELLRRYRSRPETGIHHRVAEADHDRLIRDAAARLDRIRTERPATVVLPPEPDPFCRLGELVEAGRRARPEAG